MELSSGEEKKEKESEERFDEGKRERKLWNCLMERKEMDVVAICGVFDSTRPVSFSTYIFISCTYKYTNILIYIHTMSCHVLFMLSYMHLMLCNN